MGVAARIGKPINHRILLNEILNIISRDTLPHLANPPDPKAIAEINNLMSGIYAIFNDTLQKAAA